MVRLILLISLFLLVGCRNAPDALKPMPWLFNQMPKDAPNNYKRGWRDGCESGMATMTNSMYREFYSFRQEKSLRENPTYYKSWKDSFDFCRGYAYGTLRESDQRTTLEPQRGGLFSGYMGKGIFEAGPLQMFGPGGDTLLPFQKIGPIGGDPYLGTGQSEREAVGGVSIMDYGSDYTFGNAE